MYEILIKSNPEPIFIYDEENLKFLEANSAALSLYGYTSEEFLLMDLTDLYSPEDIQTLLSTSEEMLKEGDYSKPHRHRRKDGKFIYVRISKIKFRYEDKDAVFNTIKNVTEILELEKKIQLYKSAFYNSGDIIFLTDASGIITYANDVAVSQIKISKEHLINSPLTSLCEGEDRALLNSAVFQSHLKEPASISIQLKTGEGKFTETDLVATPIINVNNDVESFSIVARIKPSVPRFDEKPKEIIKEVIKEVIVEKPAADEKKGVKSDSAFLSGVFHEILTPMNVILGFAQELTESIERLTPEQKEAVDIINQNRSSLLSIMNSIIEFSEFQQKKSELKIEEIGITEIVEPLDRSIKDITGLNDVEFAYGKISSSLKFETDKKIFESIINNLIRLVSKITDQRKIYFSAYPAEEGMFNINISDSFARGTPPLLETLSKLFIEMKDPKEVGVSKLNFQMINSLLEVLGGKFIVIRDPNEQKDCAFSFPLKFKTAVEPRELVKKPELSLPEEKEITEKKPQPHIEREEIEIEEETMEFEPETEIEAAKPDEKTIPEKEEIAEIQEEEQIPEEELTVEETIPSAKGDSFSNLSCLYIEDQIDSQILFKVQMKGLRNIQFAASFEEAIPLLETGKFDFIVMDINLQGEYNGLDALKVIHQMPGFENIPIIAVTAYVLPGDREKFIATGFNDFISKPIFREKMYDSLKKIFSN